MGRDTLTHVIGFPPRWFFWERRSRNVARAVACRMGRAHVTYETSTGQTVFIWRIPPPHFVLARRQPYAAIQTSLWFVTTVYWVHCEKVFFLFVIHLGNDEIFVVQPLTSYSTVREIESYYECTPVVSEGRQQTASCFGILLIIFLDFCILVVVTASFLIWDAQRSSKSTKLLKWFDFVFAIVGYLFVWCSCIEILATFASRLLNDLFSGSEFAISAVTLLSLPVHVVEHVFYFYFLCL